MHFFPKILDFYLLFTNVGQDFKFGEFYSSEFSAGFVICFDSFLKR
jgi:hypothetical protein